MKSISVILLLLLLLLALSSDFVSCRRTSYLIRPTEIDSADILLERLSSLTGSDLCFTEANSDTRTILQLCLQAGFRRLEVERTSSDPVDTFTSLEGNSEYLDSQLDDLFHALTVTSPSSSFDDEFSLWTKDRKSSFASPFRSDYSQRRINSLANISSEIYGRFVPGKSKLEWNRELGEAKIMFPDGDECEYHHESSSSSTRWTTHLRMLCAISSSSRSQGIHGDGVQWDIRVHASTCSINVLVFVDAVC